MKKKSVNDTFHEEPHDNKAECVRTQKVKDAEPYCACQLGFCMQGKENKIYKDATLWSAMCTAGEPTKETKTAIQNNWRTPVVLSGCTEKINPSDLDFKGFKGEMKYYLLKYKKHFQNNNPLKISQKRLQPSISALIDFALFFLHCWAQCFIRIIN